MKLLSFDIESNGLQGEAFAVGAVLMNADGTVESEFMGRCPVKGPLDAWVRDNVLPPMEGVPENYPTDRAMRDAFWEWYTEAKAAADFVLTNNPYPVEARFLIACQNDHLPVRGFDHPFPMLDLSSMLIAIGVRTREAREVFMNEAIGPGDQLAHNPRWDAWATALGAFKALKLH